MNQKKTKKNSTFSRSGTFANLKKREEKNAHSHTNDSLNLLKNVCFNALLDSVLLARLRHNHFAFSVFSVGNFKFTALEFHYNIYSDRIFSDVHQNAVNSVQFLFLTDCFFFKLLPKIDFF